MSIPNSKEGTYKIKVTYDNNISTRTGGTYKVNPDECAPRFGTISYQDVNPISLAITQNDQQIVQEYSTVRYTVANLYARKHATISSCSVSVNGHSYNLTISGDSASGGNAAINSGNNVVASFTLTDSRGVISRAYKTITILGYKSPTATIKLQRQSNFYTATDLTVHARYSSIDGHNVLTITYRAKKQGDSQYTVTGTVQNNVQTTLQSDNQYAWNVEIVLKDSFNTTTTYTGYRVGVGTPLLFIDRKKYSVGLNCFPKGEKTLEINGLQVLPGSVITCDLSSSLTNLQTDTYEDINFSGATIINNSVLNTTTSGPMGIKIVGDIDFILVSATVRFMFIGETSRERLIRIVCDDEGTETYYGETGLTPQSFTDGTLQITPILITVEKDSIIYLQYKTPSPADLINGGSTWLTAQTP
jgi:hypothetical protein